MRIDYSTIVGLAPVAKDIIDFNFSRRRFRAINWEAGFESLSRLTPIKYSKRPVGFLQDILLTWRRALGLLSVASCPLLADRAKMVAMLNCTPYGAHTTPSSRFCTVDYFCPWCWARDKLAFSKKVNKDIGELNRGRGPLFKVANSVDYASSNHLQLFGDKVVVKEPHMTSTGACDIAFHFFEPGIRTRRAFNASGAIAGRYMATVEPMTRISKTTGKSHLFWKGVNRLFALYTRECPLDEKRLGRGLFLSYGPTAAEIAYGVGNIFRYPSGYLLEQPYMTSEMLDIKQSQGYRTDAKFGAFRG